MLAELREAVRERVAEGEPLEEIEREIVDPAPLDEERRAALWLFAWTTANGGGVARPEPPRSP